MIEPTGSRTGDPGVATPAPSDPSNRYVVPTFAKWYFRRLNEPSSDIDSMKLDGATPLGFVTRACNRSESTTGPTTARLERIWISVSVGDFAEDNTPAAASPNPPLNLEISEALGSELTRTTRLDVPEYLGGANTITASAARTPRSVQTIKARHPRRIVRTTSATSIVSAAIIAVDVIGETTR